MSSNGPSPNDQSPFGPPNPYHTRTANPYAAGHMYDPAAGSADLLTQLTVVASILLAMAMLTLTMGIFSLAFNLLMGLGFEPPPNIEGEAARTGYMIGQFGVMIIQWVFQVVVILGGIAMIRRKGLSISRAASICSLVPLCGPCAGLSIPFAIWALVLLSKPVVKASYT